MDMYIGWKWHARTYFAENGYRIKGGGGGGGTF